MTNKKEDYRIKYDGYTYVIQKLIEIENFPSIWQMITKKRTFKKEWRSLDKVGLASNFDLRGRFIWPEFYTSKGICIDLIEKWTTPDKYFYPPDYEEKPTVNFNTEIINRKRKGYGYPDIKDNV